jgi:hypothetical protein
VLVYGDHKETIDPGERLSAVSERLAETSAMPPGIARHGKLIAALIEAGQVLQGVADEGWPAAELTQFVYRLAETAVRSWDSRFLDIGELPAVPAVPLPRAIELRLPEGFAFYAVYPEAYAGAARRLKLDGPPRVIGIRSIGTTLGAVAAAALGAPPPLTVRPSGDPFARKTELAPEAIEDAVHYVIVDEGPGLSGSSFGSVADALEDAGVPLERIAFLPSHGGDPGPHASERHRERWRRAQRVPAEFDYGWLAELFGPLEDISGTGRLKFLGTHNGERVLVKFAGLGGIGERKLEMASALCGAGLTPEPLGLIHGFLVERWCEGAQPLQPGEKPLEDIGRYLGARARLFPAEEESGASIGELLTMCRRNISLTLRESACAGLECFDAATLQPQVRRVRTDNKLDRHEWLRTADGRLLKNDAVDHHQAHDLIGCQDLAWDVAGAIEEFVLDQDETDRLIASTGCSVDVELLDFYRVAYASFRLGRAELAAEAAEAARYRRGLELLLLPEHDCCGTRRESSVG